MKPSQVILVTYDGGEMRGKGTIELEFKEVANHIRFEVVETVLKPYPLLGCECCLDLGLVKLTEHTHALQDDVTLSKETIMNDYDEIFKGLGKIPGEYEIKIDKAIKPVQH